MALTIQFDPPKRKEGELKLMHFIRINRARKKYEKLKTKEFRNKTEKQIFENTFYNEK